MRTAHHLGRPHPRQAPVALRPHPHPALATLNVLKPNKSRRPPLAPFPCAECEDIAHRSLLARPFKLRSKMKSHKNLRGTRMKTIDVVAAIIEKDGEILAHIENVDWLPADMKVVDALEKRGEL